MQLARFLISAVFLGLLVPEAGAQQIKVKVGINPEIAAGIREKDVDDGLRAATRLLNERASDHPDIACPVTLVRDGAVVADKRIPRDFTQLGEHSDARKLGYQLIILPQISSCGGVAGAIGCTWIGGSVVTVLGTNAKRGLIVGHEFGHAKGLLDVVEDRRIMQWAAAPRNETVTQPECDSYVSTLAAAVDPNAPSPPLPKPPVDSSLSLQDLLSGAGFVHGIEGALPSITARCKDDLTPTRQAALSSDYGLRVFALWVLGRCGLATDFDLWSDTLSTPIGTDLGVLEAKEAALLTAGVLLLRTNSPQIATTVEAYAAPKLTLAAVVPNGDSTPTAISPALIQDQLTSAAVTAKAIAGRLNLSVPNKPSLALNPQAFGVSVPQITAFQTANKLAQTGDVNAAIVSALKARTLP